MGFILPIILIIIVIWLIMNNIRIVPQAHAFVIERLGAYVGTWGVGLHLKIPFVDRIAMKVNLKEQVSDFPPQPVITKDNVTMMIDTVVYYQVTDPKLYCYGVENPLAAIENLTSTTLRNIIGDLDLDGTLTSREVINTHMRSTLDTATDNWGIRVSRVEIKNIQPPKAIEEVMTKQMRAERERRQTVLEAQAHKEAVVSRAEGDKQAKILAAEAERDSQIALAEGRAKSIALVYEAEADGLKRLTESDFSENVLRLKGLEALKDVSDGRATKIYMPSDIASAVSSLGLAGEALGIGDHTPIDTAPKPEPPEEIDACIDEDTSRGGREAAATSAQISRNVSKAADRLPG